ncbi:MAG: nuclear transport factor 2 family protein [Gaiellales bacterium]
MSEDLNAVARVKARQLRTMDTKDWDGLGRTFAPDVVLDFTEIGGTITTGADAVVAMVRSALDGATSVHQVFQPEITFTAAGASAIWAMQDVVVWQNGTRTIGFGHYHETYTRTDGEWRIATSRLTRLYVDSLPAMPGDPA